MSVQTQLDARTSRLRAALTQANTALAQKGGSPAETVSALPAAIAALPEGSAAVLEGVRVTPTGTQFTVYPEAGVDGFDVVTVEGDGNLVPNNIVYGTTIYGVTGTRSTVQVPAQYQSYWEQARTLYTGAYANLAIMEDETHLVVAFLMANFTVLTYDSATTEYTAQGFVACTYLKESQSWGMTDYRTEGTTGGTFLKNVRFSTELWTFGGETVWPLPWKEGGGSGRNLLETRAIGSLPGDSQSAANTSLALDIQVAITGWIPDYDVRTANTAPVLNLTTSAGLYEEV